MTSLSCPSSSLPLSPLFVPSLLLLLVSLPPPSSSLVLAVCPVSPLGLVCSLFGETFWEERVYASTPPRLWLIQAFLLWPVFFPPALSFISVLKGMDVAGGVLGFTRCLSRVPVLASGLRGPSRARHCSPGCLFRPQFSRVPLLLGGHSGSLEGLIHALEFHFLSLHDEICIGAHMRLTEAPHVPTCPFVARSCLLYTGTPSTLSAFAFLVDWSFSLDHHMRARLVLVPPYCEPSLLVSFPRRVQQLLFGGRELRAATIVANEACILVSALSNSVLLASRPRSVLSMWPETMSLCQLVSFSKLLSTSVTMPSTELHCTRIHRAPANV